jgi:DNA (cytosine-5)-methyltransferase 1
MIHIDLFSGIGGFALAIEETWPNSKHVFCDNNPYCQKLLKLRFPNSKVYGDIKKIKFITNSDWHGLQEQRKKQQAGGNRQLFKIDILTGGFPCQPFSQAGKRRGTNDDRYLWPEMLRIIRITNPRWVIAENVRGFVTWNDGMVFEQVCSDLENEGYEVQPVIIPAVAVNAPHRRDRVWFIAHSLGDPANRKKKCSKLLKASSEQDQNWPQHSATRQSSRAAFGGRSKRSQKDNIVAEALRDSQSSRQQSGNERSRETQHGRTSSGSFECTTSDSKGKRSGGFTCKKCRIEKWQVEQGKQEGCEIWSKSKRRACDSADSESCKSREQAKQERRQNFSRRSFKNTSDTKCDGHEKRYQEAGRKIGKSMQGRLFKFERKSWKQLWIKVAAELCGVDDGLPAKLDGSKLSKSRHRIERLKALGNAIVPQVAIEIMEAIKKIEEDVGNTQNIQN